MVWMTSRSSMKLMIRMVPRHFGQAPLNSEGLFRPPIKHFLLNHGQVTLSGRYYSTGQVRGSTSLDQVGDRLRSSGSAGPSFPGIPSNFCNSNWERKKGRLSNGDGIRKREIACSIWSMRIPEQPSLKDYQLRPVIGFRRWVERYWGW